MGEMFTDFFTKPLQGATFLQLRAMIRVIPVITPDVDMSCPRAMAKATPQDCVRKNYKQTHKTSTARTGVHGSTFTGVCRSTCMDVCGSMFTDVSTERTDVHGTMCIDIFSGSTVVCGNI